MFTDQFLIFQCIKKEAYCTGIKLCNEVLLKIKSLPINSKQFDVALIELPATHTFYSVSSSFSFPVLGLLRPVTGAIVRLPCFIPPVVPFL
jgi:hypothetical protein